MCGCLNTGVSVTFALTRSDCRDFIAESVGLAADTANAPISKNHRSPDTVCAYGVSDSIQMRTVYRHSSTATRACDESASH